MKTLIRTLVVLAGAVALVVPATAASAASRGRHCDGVQAYRCAWFNYDPDHNFLRGYGSVKDTTDGADTVAAIVYLQVNTTNGWINVASSSRLEGTDSITVSTGLATCVAGRTYRSRVNWNWNNGAGTGTIYSGDVVPC
ncbi:MAG: hypothetical protein V7603_3331 [Micromonosporaceae bacterium]